MRTKQYIKVQEWKKRTNKKITGGTTIDVQTRYMKNLNEKNRKIKRP